MLKIRIHKHYCYLALLINIALINTAETQSLHVNPYKILGIQKMSSQQEVRIRFRQLSRLFHPDKLKRQQLSHQQKYEKAKKFEQIASAYEIIKKYNFNNKVINDLYYQSFHYGQDTNRQDLQQSNEFYGQNINDLDYEILNIRMFFQQQQYRSNNQRHKKPQEQYKQLQNMQFYVLSVKFIDWTIKNKMVTLGAFFISIGLWMLTNCVKKENPTSKDLPLNTPNKSNQSNLINLNKQSPNKNNKQK